MKEDATAIGPAEAARFPHGVYSARRVIVLALVVVTAGIVVLLGQYGRRYEQASTERGIEAVRAAVGSLSSPGPTDFIVSNPGRTCLLWSVNGRVYALELCIDPQGRVVEAVDRRGWTSKFYSFTDEPSAAKLRISPALFRALVARVERRIP